MNTDLDEAIKAAFDEIVVHAPEIGPTPVAHVASASRQLKPSRRLLAAAAVLIAVGAGAATFAVRDRDSGDLLVADRGPTTFVTGESGKGPAVPGVSTLSSSEATEASALAAARLGVVLDESGWVVELREHATRGVAPDFIVQWAHFSDGVRRLFVVEGPPDLLGGPSDLLDTSQLTATLDRYSWPEEQGAATVAVRSADGSVIVRSETIDGSGSPRTLDELFGLAQQIAESQPTAAPGGLAIASVGSINESYQHSTLVRSDPEAASGPYSVVVRRVDGSLGSASAVVTYTAGKTGAEEEIVTNPSTGVSTLSTPTTGGRIQVRGVSLSNNEVRAVAMAATIIDGSPVVDLPASLDMFSVVAEGSQRPAMISEARYGCDALGEEQALGALCYTGVATSLGFEDAVYRGDFEPGPPVAGHASVISKIGGGNATLAWEPRPGVIAYVGYSGNDFGDDQLVALARLANRATFLSPEEWSATEPQVVIQTNQW